MAKQVQNDSEEQASSSLQRLDKWLWFARVAKTRTISAGLVMNGKVRVNRIRIVKPAHTVRCGDVITVSVGGGVRVLRIIAGGLRRGPASEAALLYEEIVPLSASKAVSPRPSDGDDAASEVPPSGMDQAGPVMEAGRGRPTKKDRRLLDRLRQSDDE